MGGACNLAEIAEQLHVGRKVAEIVITDQATKRLASELAEFVFVDLLEQRALVPAGVRVETKVAIDLLLGEIHDPDLEIGVGLRIHDEVVQPAPGAFDFLKLLGMKDRIHLRRQFLIDPGDHFLDGIENVRLDDGPVLEGFSHQGRYGVIDFGCRALGSRLETLLQQVRKLIGFDCAAL